MKLRLKEDFAGGKPKGYDTDHDVIPGVKLLGFKSENGRTYTHECLMEAYKKKLYEGVPVYDNHSIENGEPTHNRENKDRVGKIVNVRFIEGKGLYGDLILLKRHNLSDSLLEAANDPRKHDFYGLSHNAEGEVRRRNDGHLIVEHLISVNSVDVVQGAATNQSLFESKGTEKMKVKELFENLSVDLRLPAWKRKILVEQFGDEESPGMADDLDAEMEEMPAMDEGGDADQALKDGFRTAINACLDDDSKDMKAKIARIKELLAAEEKLISDEAPVEDVPEMEDEDSEDEDMENDDENRKDDVYESKKKKRRGYSLTESDMSKLCDKFLGGQRPTPAITKSLQRCQSLSEVFVLLEEIESLKGTKTGLSLKPARSSGQVYQTSYPKDAEAINNRLKSHN